MYSPKYVDYVDKKRIESTFYNPKVQFTRDYTG